MRPPRPRQKQYGPISLAWYGTHNHRSNSRKIAFSLDARIRELDAAFQRRWRRASTADERIAVVDEWAQARDQMRDRRDTARRAA